MDVLQIDGVGIGAAPLSLRVARGERLVLLGPTGAGKTRLLLTLAGFAAPIGGAIRVEGRDITRAAPEARDMAWAPAGPSLLPHRSVRDNIAFGPRLRGLSRPAAAARVAAALAEWGLTDVADRRPAQLPPPLLERAVLARALAIAPLLLLLDRAEASLDTLLLPPRGRNPTVLLATRRARVALAVADRIALLRHGAIVQVASPVELFARPADAFAALALGRCNLIPARIEAGRVLIGDAAVPAQPRDLPPGPCLLALRPHRLRLDPAGPLVGVVAGIAFQGVFTRLTLRRPDGTDIVADLAAVPAGLAPGQAAGLGWDQDAGWPLPAGPGA